MINNKFYNDLGDRWYFAKDDPVALLRSENKVKMSWILERIKKQHPNDLSLKILDVGCGAGFATNVLVETYPDITGVDLAEDALKVADKFSPKKVNYICADARKLPFDNQSFDIVLSLDFLEHIDDPKTVISEISRVLKPKGLFFYHTFSQNFLSYLIVIKGVEWFVKNTPPHMHTYNLFIDHKKIIDWNCSVGLNYIESTGLRPQIDLAFFKLLTSGEVSENFKFKLTPSHLISYLGYAQKK